MVNVWQLHIADIKKRQQAAATMKETAIKRRISAYRYTHTDKEAPG